MGFFKNILKEIAFGAPQVSTTEQPRLRQKQKPIEKSASGGIFDEIVGYDKLKTMFYRAIESSKPVHILLVGPPAIGKTMFLTAIERKFKDEAEMIIGDSTSRAGIINRLFQKKPKYICIDEIGLLKNDDQSALLNVMETGRVIETFKNRPHRDMEIHPWIFATSNDGDLIAPLKSRFTCLYLKEYTYEQFSAISQKLLGTAEQSLVDAMCNAVWFKQKSKDPRDVVKLSRLCKTVEEVADTVDTMTEFGEPEQGKC